MSNTKVHRAALMGIAFFLILTLEGHAADLQSVVIGSSCSASQGSYLWITSTRTTWSVSQIHAVPVGTSDPADWSQSEDFRTRLIEVLPDEANLSDFAYSCASVGFEFFSGNLADVLVDLERALTSTQRTIRCVSGSWTITAQQDVNKSDESDWIRAGTSPYDFSVESSKDLLNSNLQDLLNHLNSQPGAHTQPFDTYVSQAN